MGKWKCSYLSCISVWYDLFNIATQVEAQKRQQEAALAALSIQNQTPVPPEVCCYTYLPSAVITFHMYVNVVYVLENIDFIHPFSM